MDYRTRLRASVAPIAMLAVIGLTSTAHAQASTAPDDRPSVAATATPTASNPVAAAAATPAPDPTDIIVTAQRRNERLQDVPIAVTALTGTQLTSAGITTSQQLTEVTPGLNFSQRSGFAQPVIRGIGTSSVQVGDESSVAVYVDGVYISQMSTQLFDLSDIAGIEVLKGPQGTLFGRNATGGAINITTRTPSFTPTFDASASYGSYNDRTLSVYGSTGLSSVMALDFAGSYHGRGDYLTDTVANEGRGGFDNFALRSKLLYKPEDDLTATLIVDYEYSNDPAGTLQHVLNRNSVAELSGFDTSAGRWDLTEGAATLHTVGQGGASLQVDYTGSAFDVVSISAIRKSSTHFLVNNTGTPLPLGYFDQRPKSTDFSQELRFVSKDDQAFKWVAGGFFYYDNAEQDPLYSKAGVDTPILATFYSSQKTTAGAVFADGTFDFGEHFSLTGGARYSAERRSMLILLNGTETVPGGQEKSWGDFTPRVVATWKPTHDAMVYASFSQGFKSGVFNPTATSVTTPVNPSTVDAFEVGAKTKFGRWATINASAFYYKYHDLQVSAQTLGSAVVTLENAAQASMKGADLDATFYPTSHFKVGLGVSYLDAKYDSFPLASVFSPKPIPDTAPPGAGGAGNFSLIEDVSGNDIERSPHWTVSVTPQYTVPLGDIHDLTLSGTAYYSSGFYWDPLNRIRTNDYVMLNAQVEYRLTPHLTAAVFGRNIGNVNVYSTVIESALGDRAEYLDPRIIGGKLSYSF